MPFPVTLKMQSRERPNKCNQCDFASSQVGNLGRHLQTDSGGKPNKCNGCGYAFCNQCDFASSEAGDLRRHFKTHSGGKQKKCNQSDRQAIWGDIWNIWTNATNVNESYKNTQWRKVKQMLPMWLCILTGKRFEDTFENTQWRKVEHMHPMWHLHLHGQAV